MLKTADCSKNFEFPTKNLFLGVGYQIRNFFTDNQNRGESRRYAKVICKIKSKSVSVKILKVSSNLGVVFRPPAYKRLLFVQKSKKKRNFPVCIK